MNPCVPRFLIPFKIYLDETWKISACKLELLRKSAAKFYAEEANFFDVKIGKRN